MIPPTLGQWIGNSQWSQKRGNTVGWGGDRSAGPSRSPSRLAGCGRRFWEREIRRCNFWPLLRPPPSCVTSGWSLNLSETRFLSTTGRWRLWRLSHQQCLTDTAYSPIRVIALLFKGSEFPNKLEKGWDAKVNKDIQWPKMTRKWDSLNQFVNVKLNPEEFALEAEQSWSFLEKAQERLRSI